MLSIFLRAMVEGKRQKLRNRVKILKERTSTLEFYNTPKYKSGEGVEYRHLKAYKPLIIFTSHAVFLREY